MSTEIWRGDNDVVAQLDTNTVGGTIEVGDEFIVTFNGKVFQYTAASTSADTVRTALVTAFNLITDIPELAEVTAAATAATGAYSLTADISGKPFTQLATTTESGGGGADAQTHVKVSTTANAGPNVWEAANFDTGALPNAGDNVYIDNTSGDILYGLDQSGAGTLVSLNIGAGFTGSIGLPWINTSGSVNYYEYRETFLKINATTLNIGLGTGNGSGRLRIDCDAVANQTINVHKTGTAKEKDVYSLVLTNIATASELNLFDGTVDVDRFGGQTSTLTNVNISAGTLRTGTGTTVTTVVATGGSATFNSAITTLTLEDDAEANTIGSGAITTANVRGGTLNIQSTGTITTLNVGSNGVVDVSNSAVAITVTNCTLAAGAEINDPNGRVTFTNAIDLGDAGLDDVTLDLGRGVNVLPS